MALAEAWGSPLEPEYWMPPTTIEPIITKPTPSDKKRIIAKVASAIGLPAPLQPMLILILTAWFPLLLLPQDCRANTVAGAAAHNNHARRSPEANFLIIFVWLIFDYYTPILPLVQFTEVGNNRRMRKRLMVVFVTFLLLLTILIITRFTQASTQKANIKKSSNTFIGYVLANNAGSSYAMFSSKAQADTSKTAWQDQVARLSLFFAARQPSLESVNSSGKYNAATYTIGGNDGTYIVKVVLQKDNGTWKVQSFTSELKQ